MSEKITGSLQENILSLLIFNEKAASIIFGLVEPGLFESDFYKEIVRVAIEYYQHYKKPPKEHIADLLEAKIQDPKNPKSGELYTKLLTNLFQTKDSINEDFVLDQLNQFVRRQRLKGAIVEAALLIKDETNESLVIAENTLNKCLKSQIQVFDRGLSFSDPKKLLASLKEKITPPYPYGIKQLEEKQIGPAPGELFIFLASVSRGKSWALINLGRECLKYRKKVLHITLEMPEAQVAQRYLQTLYSLSAHATEELQTIQISTFNHDGLGRLSSLAVQELNRPSVKHEKTLATLAKKLERYKGRQSLEIRGFPTASLSIEGLEVFLDTLDRLYNYVPEVVLLDYADLMKLDYKNLRTSTGEVYKELRRIAVERNIAMVTASQANRMAEDARVITLKHLAEDYSKAATADTVIAYCVHGAQRVQTNEGLIQIKNLHKYVNQGICALSHNFLTGKDEWKPITNWFYNGRAGKDGFLRIVTENNNLMKHKITTVVTPDHDLFTLDGTKVKAKDLAVGQTIAGLDYVFSSQQKQIILGTLLGDGSIGKPKCLSMEHGEKQLYYLLWKKESLGPLVKGPYTHNHKSSIYLGNILNERTGYSLSIKTGYINEMYNLFYPKGEKIIPEGVLESLSPLGLAVWIMDDGSLQTYNKSDGTVGVRRLNLAVNCFTDENSKKRLFEYFKSKGCTFNYWGAKHITFNAQSTRLIMDEIKDYILPVNQPKQTKLFLIPKIRRGRYEVGPIRVKSIEVTNTPQDKMYDIEVADNHNFYLSSGVLVSNCQSPQEKALGLARLFVAKARGQESGQMVLISQAYGLGQFCMDSTLINDRYWTMLEDPSTTTEPTTTRPRFRSRNTDND